MPIDKKISELTQDSTPAGTDQVVLERSGAANFRSTLTEILTELGILKTLFDAHTILAAVTDNTPAALAVAEQRILGRITGGNIAALTAAEINTLLQTLTAASAVTDNRIIRGDGGARGAQESAVTLDDSGNLTGLGNVNSQRIPDGTATAITGTTHSSTSSDYNRLRPCSSAAGCTVTVDAGQGGSWIAYKATTAGQQVTLTSGTCTIAVPEDYVAVSVCAGAVIGVFFDSGGTTGTVFGMLQAA